MKVNIATPSNIIIYASRTHTQLSQVIGELKASGYSPRMIVLGSREQLCVHEKISKLRGNTLNHACSSLGAQRGCVFKNSLDKYIGGAEGVGNAPSPIMDIEELCNVGKMDKICPYFYSRDKSKKSDLILLPYNYLIDGNTRATLDIDWRNAIIIFDEGHNIEKNACDAASFSITSTDIASCIAEMQKLIPKLQEKKDSDLSNVTGRSQGSNNLNAMLKSGSLVDTPSIEAAVIILRSLFELERRIDSVPLTDTSNGVKANGGEKCCVKPGQWMVQLLLESGFNIFTV
jgi:Rad3-related DNA helicase